MYQRTSHAQKKYSIKFLLWYLQILYIKRVVRQLFYFLTWMFVYTWQERKGLMNVFRHAVDVGLKGFGQCVDDVPWKNIMSMMTTEYIYTHLVLLLYYSMFNSPLNWVKTWQFNAVQQWILSQLFLPTSVGIIKLGVYGQRNSTIKSPPAQVMSAVVSRLSDIHQCIVLLGTCTDLYSCVVLLSLRKKYITNTRLQLNFKWNRFCFV